MPVMVAPSRAAVVKAAVLARMTSMATMPPSDDAFENTKSWDPEPYQVTPPGEPGVDWDLWLMIGGRGIGKTLTMAHYVNEHVLGPPCDSTVPGGHRIGIVSPTLGDAVDACVKGPTGLKAFNPGIVLRGGLGGYHISWPNGAEGKLFSTATKVNADRLRSGGNRCLDFWDELAAWPQMTYAYDQAMLGLRLGPRAHAVAATTPRPIKKLIEIKDDERTRWTHGTTDDNPHLSEQRRAHLRKLYAGTPQGRQELGGEILMSAQGALWRRDLIDLARVRRVLDIQRVVIGVDPSGGSEEGHDEQGIVVCASGGAPEGVGVVRLPDGSTIDVTNLQHGYVLDDCSCLLDPDGWGRQVVRASLDWEADLIVVEKNFGGEMCKSTIENAARAMKVSVNVKLITSSRGKTVRAEPVAAYTPQQRMHLVNGSNGTFDLLEDELVSWVPGMGRSPNRLDAMVFGMTELLVEGGVGVWSV